MRKIVFSLLLFMPMFSNSVLADPMLPQPVHESLQASGFIAQLMTDNDIPENFHELEQIRLNTDSHQPNHYYLHPFFETNRRSDFFGYLFANQVIEGIMNNLENEDDLAKLTSLLPLVHFSIPAPNGDYRILRLLKTLIHSNFFRVRMKAARIARNFYPAIGFEEGFRDDVAQSFTRAYFSEADPELKLELQHLVEIWDPEALVYGQRGIVRSVRQWLSRRQPGLTCNMLFDRMGN